MTYVTYKCDSFSFNIYFIFRICMCVYVGMFLWVQVRGTGSSGTGLISGCEPVDVGAGNWTFVSGRTVHACT